MFHGKVFKCAFLYLTEYFNLSATFDPLFFKNSFFFFFDNIKIIKQACGVETEGGSGFTGSPDIDQALKTIFFLL